jgi:nucleotide-binding universal stress UspA family protein
VSELSHDEAKRPVLQGPVLVGVDGSDNSQRALSVAARLAGALGTDVRAVHALGMMTIVEGRRVPSHDHRSEIEVLLGHTWCAPLRSETDLRWTAELRDGNPAEVLLHMADEIGAALIVVGARGVGGDPNLMLGSTSHHVVHHAHCPSVVVPPGV